MPDFQTHPGYFFVAATLLPLASFLLIFLASGLWCLARRYREAPGWEAIYELTGGDRAGKRPAYIATAAIGLAFLLCLYGGILHTQRQSRHHHVLEDAEAQITELEGRKNQPALSAEEREAVEKEIHEKEQQVAFFKQAW